MAHALGRKSDLANALAGLGHIRVAERRVHNAVLILGAVDSLLDGNTSGLLLKEAHYAQSLSIAARQLGVAAFQAAWDEARGLTLEQAIEVALAETNHASQAKAYLQPVQEKFGGLTPREREVAVLIAQGKSNPEIAEMLVVSERTVTTHVSNIFSKLGFTSRTQVASWATARRLNE